MTKKIFSMAVAAITAAALCVTAIADDYSTSHHGSVKVSDRRQYAREFKATTTYLAVADEIFAGIQCARYDTGAAASENLLESRKNTFGVSASVSVDYVSYPMLVRAFSSHTAYKNGKQLFEEYNMSETA